MTPPARVLALFPVVALALAGCGNDSTAAGSDGKVVIVASTNVYGDIAQAIGGDNVSVTSLITSSAQDPHEYEASTQDRVVLDKADIVVENGAGYDHFVDTMLDDAKSDATVLTAVAISGLLPADKARGADEIEGFNEHVWYKFDAVDTLAKQLSDDLAEQDKTHASAYRANYQTFSTRIQGLEKSAADLKATASGKGVAITEPVPLYLLTAAGLTNKTPAEFSQAVEEGQDVPPRALQQTLDLFSQHQVALLAYNAQTANATTEQARAAAEKANIPVVDFTETLPDGKSYVEWQQDNIDHLTAALG